MIRRLFDLDLIAIFVTMHRVLSILSVTTLIILRERIERFSQAYSMDSILFESDERCLSKL